MEKKRFVWLWLIIFIILPHNVYPKYLVKINGEKYSEEDFIHWWENWREKNQPPPETLDPYIDWILLYQEAKRMKLYEDPAYRRKIRIFREVRSLLMLRWEEVGKKIKITEDELWEYYKKNYTPIFHLELFTFESMDKSKKFLKEVEKTNNMTEAAKKLNVKRSVVKRRLRSIPLPFRKDLENGKTISGPKEWNGKVYIVKVIDKSEGSKEDFEKIKKRLERKLRRKKEWELTEKLIEKLKRKYNVSYDEELLEKINIKNPQKELMDKVLLRIGRRKLTVREFLFYVNKQISFRKRFGFPLEDEEKFKKRILDTMISQTLTSWEALNRHYEKNPPFKWIYEFYCQRRLIKELEKKVIKPMVKVTEEDLRKYYEENKEKFKTPPLLKIAYVFSKDKKLIRMIARDIKEGKDLFDAARDRNVKIIVKTLEADKLPEPLKSEVESMEEGEISEVINIDGGSYIIKLIERGKEKVRTFKEVRLEIKEKLEKERFNRIRSWYIAQLRRKSSIKINEKAWKKLKKRLKEKYVKEAS